MLADKLDLGPFDLAGWGSYLSMSCARPSVRCLPISAEEFGHMSLTYPIPSIAYVRDMLDDFARRTVDSQALKQVKQSRGWNRRGQVAVSVRTKPIHCYAMDTNGTEALEGCMGADFSFVSFIRVSRPWILRFDHPDYRPSTKHS